MSFLVSSVISFMGCHHHHHHNLPQIARTSKQQQNSATMPPNNDGVRRQKKAKTDKNKELVQKKTASRNLDAQFQVLSSHRGHCKECGDPTCCPCGSEVCCDGHHRDCQECDACRFVMDAWAKANREMAVEGNPEPVPALTGGCIMQIVGQMGLNAEQVKAQDDSWTPHKPFEVHNQITGRMEKTPHSFVQRWEGLKGRNKVLGVRPKLPLPRDFDLSKGQTKAVPHQHRKLNTHTDMMECIIHNAIVDGKLSEACLRQVVENCGGVDSEDSMHQHCTNACGIDSHELIDWVDTFPDPNSDELEVHLEDCKMSPRLLHWRATGNNKSPKLSCVAQNRRETPQGS